MRRSIALPGMIVVYAILSTDPVAARQGDLAPVDAPRAGSRVVIDGRLDGAEWARAAARTLSDGTVLRFQHDGRHLFVAIAAARSGFPSLCLGLGDTVRVLHASAALGSVRYLQAGGEWVTGDTAFVYGMRSPDTTDQARQERSEYLRRNGWVASTFRMSGGMVQEMQILIGAPVPRLALGYFVSLQNNISTIESWPAPGEPLGCSHPELVRGTVPRRLDFRPATWAELRLLH